MGTGPDHRASDGFLSKKSRNQVLSSIVVQRHKRNLLILFLVVLALRLPFLNQAFVFDDVYYLEAARYALTQDIWHPHHARYVFQGDEVSMLGHPHPPLNSWFLAGCLKLFGGARERPLHAAYLLWSLLSVWSLYWLAARFTSRPLIATLLLTTVPAWLVEGNSLMADLPLLGLWLLSITSFVYGLERNKQLLLAVSVVAQLLAGLAAYQAALLTAILWTYLWFTGQRATRVYLLCIWAPVASLCYQLYEWVSTGTLPFLAFASYASQYGLQRFELKLRNFAGLTAHLAWITFPLLVLKLAGSRGYRALIIAALAAVVAGLFDPSPLFIFSFGLGCLVIDWVGQCCRARQWEDRWLGSWALFMILLAYAIFYAGAARYLLPLAPALILLVVRNCAKPSWLVVAIAGNGLLAVLLAVVSYQHWNAYRSFVEGLKLDHCSRLWVNGEWGLRFYGAQRGARQPLVGQQMLPGDCMIQSQLAYPVPLDFGNLRRELVQEQLVSSEIPLRLIGLGTRSGYATVALGVRPFDLGTYSIDRISFSRVAFPEAELSRLQLSDPAAAAQLVAGFYQVEGSGWRWIGREAFVLLRRPAGARQLVIAGYAPDQVKARKLELWWGEQRLAVASIEPGREIALRIAADRFPQGPVLLKFTVDQTFVQPPDVRELGVILRYIGFEPD